jgi:hypothetical protein
MDKDFVRSCYEAGIGGKNYAIPGESVTITRKAIGEPLQSQYLSAVIAAGADDQVPWSDFVAHAVGLQYCTAKSMATLDEAFWSWLEDRPELLLSLAATAYPVQPKIWENMQRLWQEDDIQKEASRNPDFASSLVGFAYMQRKTSMTGHPITVPFENEAGDGHNWLGHSGKFADGTRYGTGKTPVQGNTCAGYESGFPERDEHPTALEAVKDRLQLGGGAIGFPWPMVPLGMYPPLRECEWVRKTPSAKCPYNLALFKWKNGKTPAPQNPFCKGSDWHPESLSAHCSGRARVRRLLLLLFS